MEKRQKKRTELPVLDMSKDGILPPHSIASEEYVLGACMIDSSAFAQVRDCLTIDMFYDLRHQKVYNSITELVNLCKPVDILMVAENLNQKGVLQSIGGGEYITLLSNKASNLSYLQYHIRTIRQKYLARELITLCRNTSDLVKEGQDDIDEVIEKSEKALFKLTVRNSHVQNIALLAKDINSRFSLGTEGVVYNSDGSYITTGYPELDNILVGWGKSDLIVVAGRPAMGKSTFVTSSAIKLAMDNHLPTLIFSVEKSAKQLAQSIVSNVCDVPGQKLRGGNLAPYEQGSMDYNMKKLYGVPLFIDDMVSLSVSQIWKRSLHMVRNYGVKIIFIDYLQLLKGNKRNYMNRYEEVSDIIISLKKVARELEIPIVITSQMSRRSDEKNDFLGKKPNLTDLRDSGAIEEVADKVCLLYRPAFYDIKQNDKGKNMDGILDVIIAKNHDGEEGERFLKFRGEFHSIKSLDPNWFTGSAESKILKSKIFHS